jgi:glycosyltransferase involved in cell wall biosynthesis
MINKSISIVIPAHNEGIYIEKCLQAIITNCRHYMGETEIIVVDNNSTDDTFSLASSFDVKVINTDASTPAEVRNEGAKLASYEILAFVDGDCIVTEQWLELINNAYQNDKIGAYGGQHIAPKDDNWVVTSWNPTELKHNYEEKAKLPGGNFSIRKTIFWEIGGFDQNLTSAEDDHLSKQVLALGYLCVLDSCNYIIHCGYPKTLVDIFKKQQWHGKTQIQAHGHLGDKVVLVTYVWLISLILLVCGGIVQSTPLMLTSIFGMILSPLAILINRMKYHNNIRLQVLPAAFIIAVFFIAGRSSGLLQELIMLTRANRE